jgi:UDP-4-amino-4,6-dideoxy-N-acetyl-beta-L-altrosamine transaminase
LIAQPFLSYGRQVIEEDDIIAVSNVLRSDWLTTGPAVDNFEAALAQEVGAEYAIACSSGTAALYLAFRTAALRPGDAVIVPTITFVATASANILAGLEVVFADVDAKTGLMTVEHAAQALRRGGKERVKAICPVHLGGRVDDPVALHAFADQQGLIIIEDACHALGTRYSGNDSFRVGECEHSLAACFSFHPLKSIAMGEGGAVTTNSRAVAERVRLLRNHGMSRTPESLMNCDIAFAAADEINPWYYEVAEISHNFRASDINCALGLSQLRKLGRFLEARKNLMARYQKRIAPLAPAIRLVPNTLDTEPGWHLCTVLVEFERIGITRHILVARLKAQGIGTQVHYIPVHMQPFYHERCGDIDLPGAWAYYSRTLSLPLFPSMTESDVDRVVDALEVSIKAGGN